jgi:hypothetical protein
VLALRDEIGGDPGRRPSPATITISVGPA